MRRFSISPPTLGARGLIRDMASVAEAARKLAADVAAERGDNDRALLQELVEASGLTPDEERAFDDMLDDLVSGRRRELSERQRGWALSAADRVGISADRSEENRRVPRGRDVSTPDALSAESLAKALVARRSTTG